ncbi:hypothetical protein GCM10023238_01770 [Streptomyces heliomycini]
MVGWRSWPADAHRRHGAHLRFFRDAFPHVVGLISTNAYGGGERTEPAAVNYVRRAKNRDGHLPGTATGGWAKSARIFGSKPGAYGPVCCR